MTSAAAAKLTSAGLALASASAVDEINPIPSLKASKAFPFHRLYPELAE